MRVPATLALTLGALIIALAACKSGGDGGTTPSPAGGETATPTGQPQVADCAPNLTQVTAGENLSWEQILPSPVPAPEGWEVRKDAGGGPFLAVLQGPDRVGSVELLQFPLEESFDPALGFAELLEWAEAYYGSVREDRIAGYGPDYGFEADEPAPAPFGGLCGMRYGFTGSELGGTAAERFVGYITFDEANLYLATAFFDSATASEGIGFRDEASVRAYEDSFGDLVAALQLP